MSSVLEMKQGLSNYVTINLLSTYATDEELRDYRDGVMSNVNRVESNLDNVSGNLNLLNTTLNELSARLCGNVDLENVSAIVTSIVSSYIYTETEEEDYSDIYDNISDFNNGF